MGFLGDFMGGAAEAGAGVIGNQIKLDQQADQEANLAKIRADLETQKAITVEKTRQQLQLENAPVLAKVENDAKMAAEQSRADKLKQATQGILDKTMSDNAAKFYADGSEHPVDSMADEEKAQFAPTEAQRSAAVKQAGLDTGQLNAHDAATLDQRSDASNNLLLGKMNHDDNLNLMKQMDISNKQALAAIAASGGKGSTDLDKKVEILKKAGKSDADIANFIMERKQPSLEDLANGFLKSDPNLGTKAAMSVEDAFKKATALRSITQSTATPDQPPSASIPSGMKLIGKTPDGRSVYQDASGKKFAQ